MSEPAEAEGVAGSGRLGGRGRRHRRFSSVLRDLAREPGTHVSVGDLMVVFGDRAFGALMLVLAVPNLIPTPVNPSAILGVPLILITGQLAAGRKVLWLPLFITKRAVPRAWLRLVVDKVLPSLRRVERLLQPRLPWLFGPLGDRVIGIVTLGLSVILFLPVFGGNWLPALSISLFALALLQRDGFAAIAGYAAALASLVVLALIAGGIFLAARAMIYFLGSETGWW